MRLNNFKSKYFSSFIDRITNISSVLSHVANFVNKISPNFLMEEHVNFQANKCEKKNTTSTQDMPGKNQTNPIKITEGKASIYFNNSQGVFYNPVQEFNRDISVAVIKQFVKTVPVSASGIYDKRRRKNQEICISILEALSASGLRSIRYALEINGINKIIANDMSLDAYNTIVQNIKKNNVEDIVTVENEDAVLLMYKRKKAFDIVDIDPYGTPAPFLDSAVQSVVDGGLLMVTCTDMAILCGNGPEACHAKYGAMSAKVPYCHEMALRIALQSIEAAANKYGRYIEPVLSLSVDFYIRLFLKIYSGPAIVKKSISKLSLVYICRSCTSFYLQPIGTLAITERGSKYIANGPPVDRKCPICDGDFKICGPIWSANLHNKEFIHSLLQSIHNDENCYGTAKRMLGMLNVVYEELDDCPLYHKIDKLCGELRVVSPTMIQFRSALLHAGYKVSLSHAAPNSTKTNAPQQVIWDIMRIWAHMNMGKKTLQCEPSRTIMNKPTSIEVSFEERPDANPESRMQGLLRFQLNPQPHWGPKTKAQISLLGNELQLKSKKYQGKKQRNILSDDDDMQANNQSKKLKNEDKQKVT